MSATADGGPGARIEEGGGNRCALWWRGVPEIPGERAGCIGEVTISGPGSRLVEEAVLRLRREGCSFVLAPMDGNTWNSYRCVTGGSREPPFFLEPVNPDFYPDLFRAAGFEVLARYTSSVVDLGVARPLERVEARLARSGVTIRPIRMEEFGAELDRLFALSLAAFAENFLYTPIEREAFGRLYDRIEPLVDPAFVRLAVAGEETAGFIFACPDYLEERRTGTIRTLVVKTLATHPRWRHLGIGSVLVEQVQAAARERGYARAIHALQHEKNPSLNITRRDGGRVLREYSLFGRALR